MLSNPQKRGWTFASPSPQDESHHEHQERHGSEGLEHSPTQGGSHREGLPSS